MYGEPSSCYGMGDGHNLSPSLCVQYADPRHGRGGGREGSETGQAVWVEEFSRGGYEVICVQQALGASPAEQRRLQMQGVFAAYERALIQVRGRLERM